MALGNHCRPTYNSIIDMPASPDPMRVSCRRPRLDAEAVDAIGTVIALVGRMLRGRLAGSLLLLRSPRRSSSAQSLRDFPEVCAPGRRQYERRHSITAGWLLRLHGRQHPDRSASSLLDLNGSRRRPGLGDANGPIHTILRRRRRAAI